MLFLYLHFYLFLLHKLILIFDYSFIISLTFLIKEGFSDEIDFLVPINSGGSIAIKSGSNIKFLLILQLFLHIQKISVFSSFNFSMNCLISSIFIFMLAMIY